MRDTHVIRRRIACLCLTAFWMLTAGSALASDSVAGDALDAQAAFDAALRADQLALTPLDDLPASDRVLSLSPDGTRILALRDGEPILVQLDEGLETHFWTLPEESDPDFAVQLAHLTENIDAASIVWSSDGNYVAFVDPLPTFIGTEGLLWLADFRASNVRPARDKRIADAEDLAYFTGVQGVAFVPGEPVFYFVAKQPAALPMFSERLLIYYYDCTNDFCSMLESTGQSGGFLSEPRFDGRTLAMTVDTRGPSFLLTLEPLHPIRRTEVITPAGRLSTSTLIDLRAGTAVLGTSASGMMLASVDQPEVSGLESLWVIDPDQSSEARWFARPVSEPDTAAEAKFRAGDAVFSVDGRYLAVLGYAGSVGGGGDEPQLYIVELATGVCGRVALPEARRKDADNLATILLWSENGRMLIKADGVPAIFTLGAAK